MMSVFNYRIRRSRLLLTLWLIMAGWVAGSQMTANAASGNRQNYEPAVLAIIDLIQAGKLNQALTLADRHVAEFPKSRIGHLLKGDILLAMSSQLHQVGELVDTQSEALDGLKHQLRNRWRHLQDYSETSRKYVPASLVDMGNHKYVIVTDLKAGRLYLYENQHDRPILVRDYYLTVGAAGYGKEITGDKKTPVGVYSIYEYIEPQKLPDRYGKGAFPVNYPNRFDKYRQRTGYGIWLHGSPSDTYARSPWASDGCFVLSNDDLLDIEQYIDVQTRTPVILSDTIDWISVEQLQLQRNRFLGILESWKRDWESLDTAAYLAHYSKDNFNFGKASFTRWADRKKQVNDAKTFIQVDLDIKSLFVYPGEQDMFVVQYRQKYLSNNYAGEVNKEQYWQRDKQGQWKIIYEG